MLGRHVLRRHMLLHVWLYMVLELLNLLHVVVLNILELTHNAIADRFM